MTWCRIAGDLQVGSGNWTDCNNTMERSDAGTRATTASVNASWVLDPGSTTGGQAYAMSTVNRFYRHDRHAPACGLRVLVYSTMISCNRNIEGDTGPQSSLMANTRTRLRMCAAGSSSTAASRRPRVYPVRFRST